MKSARIILLKMVSSSHTCKKSPQRDDQPSHLETGRAPRRAPSRVCAWLAVLLTLLGVATPEEILAATYYVSKTGNDTNSGTIESPFLTVQKGVNVAYTGDTVSVGSGVYTDVVSTARAGSAGSPITIDGGQVATIKKFTFKHYWITVRNFTFTGATGAYADAAFVTFAKGSGFCSLSNNVLECAGAFQVPAIAFTIGTGMPFPTNAGNNCIISSNAILNGNSYYMVAIKGDNNIVERNCILNGTNIDFVWMHGRSNVFRQNVCSNDYYSAHGAGFHADFIQTTGLAGEGSSNNLIEGNLVCNLYSAQLSQLEGNLIPEIGDWTFRNNIFFNIAATANCSIPNVRYYNNVFFRCNFNSGSALSFGSRGYGQSVAAPDSLIDGATYQILSTSGTGTVFYVSRTYSNFQYLTATNGPSFTTNGDAQLWLQVYNQAHGARVYNNVFLDCGTPETNRGWYSIAVELTNVAADYNYVGKSGYKMVKVDSQHRAAGDPRSWDVWSWWETNGINGGNPRFGGIANLNFHLLTNSPLIGAATNLSALFETDFNRATRTNPWDIGAFKLGTVPSRPSPLPTNLLVVP